ncbi:hypothetical protein [Nocardia sp. alder85J]|uniref:hypothetical protein n=1 Tax=Nocardia sp. alder85J TaxID=2862949 RepID=UPI001CD1C001|nr:hypothetical protein [Nocardia sp. alder85J]MCX4092788.1 hypothetical protein [Nocardia sp. alder85J]
MSNSRMIVPALCAGVFVVGTSEYPVAGLLPQVGTSLHLSVGTAGQAVTVYALDVVIGGPR